MFIVKSSNNRFRFSPNLVCAAIGLTVLLSAGCAGQKDLKPDNTPIFSELGDDDNALAYATELPIESAAQGIAKGDAALARGDVKRALFEYIRALEVGGEDPTTLYKVGRIHLLRGDVQRAEMSFALALRSDPEHHGVLLELGILQLKRRNYDAAERLLGKANELSPDIPRLQNALGVLADMKQDYAAAQTYYQRAISLNERSPLYFNNLGYSRYLTGDLAGAEEAFEDALRVNSDYERAWRNLALVYTRQGNHEHALEALRRIGSLPAAYNDLGYLAMIDGRLDEAGAMFDEALRLSPTSYELAGRNARRLQRSHQQPSLGAEER